MSTGGNSSNRQKFNIHIVEDHNDALEFIYKEIGSKLINFNDLTMIHFDSHPDLGIPDMLADNVYKKEKLFESVSIESWIIPAVYAGHLKNLVWVKPVWSNQINSGKYEISIGKNVDTGRLKCDSRECYFVCGDMYSTNESLINKKTLTLYVYDFNDVLNQQDHVLSDLLKSCSKKNLIFDIDLDFFSTRDPFKEFFKQTEEFELFKKVYSFPFVLGQNDPEFDQKYQKHSVDKTLKMDKMSKYMTGTSDDKEEGFEKLRDIIETNKIDFEILHAYGSGMDELGLPHHVSTNDEIKTMMAQFEVFIEKYFKSLSIRPGLVTMARSSLDEYCPIDQVEFIQNETLNILQKCFESDVNKVNHNY